MNTETEGFGAIYAEIQKEFTNDPDITVKPSAGDPPNQYEVTYSIPSTIKDPEGNIIIGDQHIISIIVPFGFPHFSPSCKPLSPIFHPDVDSAAICLGNYWNRERSLPELIRYIKTMLTGEVFSTENAFNQEAATWYKNHQDELPFYKTENETNEEPLNTLKVNYDEIPQETFSEEKNLEDFDTTRLFQLFEQKQLWQLDTVLSQLAESPTTFPGKEELTGNVLKILNKANKLFLHAEQCEEDGNSKEALKSFLQIQQLVIDYPGIDDHIQRTKLSAEILDNINEDLAEKAKHSGHKEMKSEPSPTETAPQKNNVFSFLKKLQKKHSSKKESPEQQIQIFEEETQKSFNIFPLLILGGLCCIAGTLAFYYSSLTGKFTTAQQLYKDCTIQFLNKDFHAAEKSCLNSLEITSSIFLFHGTEKKSLQTSIRKILNSEELQQGLLGNVLYKGHYISNSLLEAHQSFFASKKKGDDFFTQQLWEEAISSYRKALQIAHNTQDIPATELVAIEKNLENAAIQIKLRSVETAINEHQWAQAIEILTGLEKKLSTLEESGSNPELQKEIKKLLAEGQFVKLKNQADLLFSQSDWNGAFEIFQQAIATGKALSGSNQEETIDSLRQNAARAELYATINAGNTAFTSGEWDNAIAHYQKAKKLLTTNPILKELEDGPNRQHQIARIILQAALLREKQSAERHKKEGNYKAALRNIQDMIHLIAYSDFNNDPEFTKTRKQIERSQKTLRNEIFIKKLQQHLTDNYISLFIENYPAASPNTLTTPEAIFVKRLKDKYLFKLQCTETGRGRPLTLIMFYTYNPANNSWQFHNTKE